MGSGLAESGPVFLVHVEHAQLDGIAEAGVCVADKPHEVLDVNNGIHLDAMRSCLGLEWMRLGRAESPNPSARLGRRRARARPARAIWWDRRLDMALSALTATDHGRHNCDRNSIRHRIGESKTMAKMLPE